MSIPKDLVDLVKELVIYDELNKEHMNEECLERLYIDIMPEDIRDIEEESNKIIIEL